MGQQEGTRFSPSPLSYTLRPERLLVLALLAITLMFGVAYAQLLGVYLIVALAFFFLP